MGKSGAQAATRKNIKKGKDACQRKLWNQGEDDAIVDLVAKYGTKRWTFIAQQLTDEYHIGGRTGKQCRERWHNHLDPSIKKSPINLDEERIIFDAHKVYGNKWADIAKLLHGRSDNCIKNYYYSTLRKHIRRINKSLKQCQVAKKLNLKVKCLTADILFPLVKESKITYSQVKTIDPKKFEDLEHTMRMIFNHEDGQQVTQRGIIAAAQNRLKVEQKLAEMRQNELNELKQTQTKKRNQKAKSKDQKNITQSVKASNQDQESEAPIEYSQEKSVKNIEAIGSKRPAHGQQATKDSLGKRMKNQQENCEIVNESNSDSEPQIITDQNMDGDAKDGNDNQNQINNLNKTFTNNKGVKTIQGGPQKSKLVENQENTCSQKLKTKNKLSTKKNSTLLEEQFKNIDKKGKSLQDLNPFSMDSETNGNQLNYSAKFGQSKESARLTNERSARETSRENQHQSKSNPKQKTVTQNLLKPTNMGLNSNLQNRQFQSQNNGSSGQQFVNLAGLQSVPFGKMQHPPYYSGFMPSLQYQGFYKSIPGEYYYQESLHNKRSYMYQAQKSKKREVTENGVETDANPANVTKYKNQNSQHNLHWQESGVSQREKKDKKKKKKKDKKKSKRDRDEKYRSKQRQQMAVMPHNFIHSYPNYPPAYPDDNCDVQDASYHPVPNNTLDLLHLQQQKSSSSRFYPTTLFPNDSREVRDHSLKKPKDQSASSVPYVYGANMPHQNHIHLTHPNQNHPSMGGSQTGQFHGYEHMHGMPPMFYPYSNGYFFGQGNPHHQMHPGLYQQGVHSSQIVEVDKQNSAGHDYSKGNKKQRQKSEDSHHKKTGNHSKEQLQEKTSKKLQASDDKLNDDETSNQNNQSKNNDKSGDSDAEMSDSKSKTSKKSQNENSKDKKLPNNSFIAADPMTFYPSTGFPHIPIQAFYQIGQTGKLQMPQQIGIPIAHANHHPALAFHPQFYQFGQMPTMNPLYGHLSHKNEHDAYFGGSQQHLKQSKGDKKKESSQNQVQGQGVQAQQPGAYRHHYNHNQFEMPPTPNNVKLQTLQKDISGLMYADQTPKGAPGGMNQAPQTPRDGLTPKSVSGNEFQNRKPRKMSNNIEKIDEEEDDNESESERLAEQPKKRQNSNHGTQMGHQQPSTQIKNNIMFIKYAPNIGRKRDKSQLTAANDTKTQENGQLTQDNCKINCSQKSHSNMRKDHSQISQENESKNENENVQNSKTNTCEEDTAANKKNGSKTSNNDNIKQTTNTKNGQKPEKLKQQSKETSTNKQIRSSNNESELNKQMVVKTQFLSNFGELAFASEFFGINQYANIDIDMSDSENSSVQQTNQEDIQITKQGEQLAQIEQSGKNQDQKLEDKLPQNLVQQLRKLNDNQQFKDGQQNTKDKQGSPKRQGAQSKKEDLPTNKLSNKNIPIPSFKQMKPRMGLNKDFNKTILGLNELINSKGITPNGQSIQPLPSTSHFLATFVQNQGNLQQSVKNQQAQQALKSLKANDLLNSQSASIGINLFKRLQMTPKPNNGLLNKQSVTPVGATSQKMTFQAMNELLKKEQQNQQDQIGVPRLLSTKHLLNSGHSFNEHTKMTQSRLNTKTNAQLTSQKIVTPRATSANDPEARKIILEKLLQSAAHKNEQNTDQKPKQELESVKDCHIHLGGAFTKKQKPQNSQKDSNEIKIMSKCDRNDDQSFKGNDEQESKDKQDDKESQDGLEPVPQPRSQTLDLNQEPLSSLYTGAPDQKNKDESKTLVAEKSLLSASKQHSISQIQIQTPLLGGKIQENNEEDVKVVKTKGFTLGTCHEESKKTERKEDKDSILAESVDENNHQKDYSQPQDQQIQIEVDCIEIDSNTNENQPTKRKTDVLVDIQDVDQDVSSHQ